MGLSLLLLSASHTTATADLFIAVDPGYENQTITIPTTGTTVVSIIGGANGSPVSDGFGILGDAETSPPNPVILNFDSGSNSQAEKDLDKNGSITDETFFTFTISSSATPGMYSGTVTLMDETTGMSNDASFNLTLQAAASAAPEPSTAIVAAFGAVAFIAYGWSRHRRAQRRQAAA
jgi:hypothetical protein